MEGRLVLKADASGPRSARVVLADSRVEAAVLETARGGIIRSGLGYDEASVGVVTNVSPDHEGQDGADTLLDVAHAKSLVVETIAEDGNAVLNADDPIVRAMARRARGRVVLVSVADDNPWLRQHVAAGGMGVGIRGGHVTLLEGTRRVQLAPTHRLPFAFNGKSRSALGNALLAAASAWALGLSPEVIATALGSFPAGITGSPGRFNLYQMPGERLWIWRDRSIHNAYGALSAPQGIAGLNSYGNSGELPGWAWTG
ncbi:MAG TPA: hypothetical protein DEQ28_04655 [Clostridiales bacterium]|nr:hypothetical protein [Clostridiales bacterium]